MVSFQLFEIKMDRVDEAVEFRRLEFLVLLLSSLFERLAEEPERQDTRVAQPKITYPSAHLLSLLLRRAIEAWCEAEQPSAFQDYLM